MGSSYSQHLSAYKRRTQDLGTKEERESYKLVGLTTPILPQSKPSVKEKTAEKKKEGRVEEVRK